MSTAEGWDPLHIAYGAVLAFVLLVALYAIITGEHYLFDVLASAALIAFGGFALGVLYSRRRNL